MSRKITAHYIFPANHAPLKRGIVVLNDEGIVKELIDTGGELRESERLEHFDGIITPGFVNAHTHLELSHLKGQIPAHTGLPDFIRHVGRLRGTQISDKAFVDAENEMLRNGIVAAGDISNTAESFALKQHSKLAWFTFIELLGIDNEKAAATMAQGRFLLEKLQQAGLHGSISPHAPYSISDKLLEELTNYSRSANLIWSVHNQECEAEQLLFNDKSGELANFLSQISPAFGLWKPRGCSSLTHFAEFYKQITQTLLVHNTFTTATDLESLTGFFHKIVLVLCPNANLYIENRLPDVEMLRKSGISIAIGTDSLASNHKLSVLEEMKTLQNSFKSIPLHELVNWATINGAKALGFDKTLGSICVGKKPGLNLISNIDFQKMQLTSASKVTVIV